MRILKYYLIVTLILITGCGISGKYQFTGYNTNIEVFLHSDNTFKEYIVINTETDTFYGNWSRHLDTIKLEIIRPKIPNYIDSRTRVEEFYDSKSDSIKIKVNIDDGDYPLQGIVCINGIGDKPINANSNGEVVLPSNENLESFSPYCLGCPSYEYLVKDKNSNLFIAYIYGYTESPKWTRYNATYKWLLKGRILYSIDRQSNEVDFSRPYEKKIFKK